MEEERIALLGCTLAELKSVVLQQGMPSFTAKQLMEWIYKKRVFSFDAMTNISKSHRERLAQHFSIGVTAPVERMESVDGTVKYLFRIREGQYVEAVFIPSVGTDDEEERATLCISTQVGCKMHCKFCMTGRQGFSGNLTAGEILNQIVAIPESDRLTNVVLMGMGEPMDNLDEVLKALSLMTCAEGFAWSPKRITVSTVGIKNTLHRFLKECECHLAVSLHASSPSVRAELMPAERAYSMTEIVDELRNCDFSHQRRLSFEYILFAGVNDSPADARRLVRLLDGIHCRINLIRFHRIPDAELEGVDDAKMIAFRDMLTRAGVFTTIRASRGEDVMAACGLLSTLKLKKKQTIKSETT